MGRFQLSASLGVVVRKLRTELGLSQERLAEAANVHRNYVGMVERGECAATVDVAERLAVALGLTVVELIERADGQRARGIVPSKTKRSQRQSS